MISLSFVMMAGACAVDDQIELSSELSDDQDTCEVYADHRSDDTTHDMVARIGDDIATVLPERDDDFIKVWLEGGARCFEKHFYVEKPFQVFREKDIEFLYFGCHHYERGWSRVDEYKEGVFFNSWFSDNGLIISRWSRLDDDIETFVITNENSDGVADCRLDLNEDGSGETN